MATKSLMLGACFADAAAAVGAEYLDLAGVVSYSEPDQMHLEAEGHHAVAEAIAPLARCLAPPP